MGGRPLPEAGTILVGPRNGREIGVDFASNYIVPYELADGGQRVMVDYGKVPLGREAEARIVDKGDGDPLSPSSSHVYVLLDHPEKASPRTRARHPNSLSRVEAVGSIWE